MSFHEWLIIAALIIVPALVFKKFFNQEVYGFLVLIRTKHGLRLLDKLAKKRVFWQVFGDLGIVFAFGLFGLYYLYKQHKPTAKNLGLLGLSYIVFLLGATLATVPVLFSGKVAVPWEILVALYVTGIGGFVLYSLILNTGMILASYSAGSTPLPGVAPLIPGVEIEGSPISVPLHALFGLLVLVIVHELAHGIVARAEGIRVKSMGLVTAGIFPIGAFAEPDEKQMLKMPARSRLRVFSAGSMSNFLTGFVFLLLFSLLLPFASPRLVQDQQAIYPALVPDGDEFLSHLQVTHVAEGSPAALAGITNATKVYNVSLYRTDKTPDKVEFLGTDKGVVRVQRNASGLIGISYAVVKDLGAYTPWIWFEKYFFESVFWIYILNFLVGVINFLPLAIFDGARIFNDLLLFYLKDKQRAKFWTKAMTIFITALLVVNVAPYFIKV